jgi:hypothetical protein
MVFFEASLLIIFRRGGILFSPFFEKLAVSIVMRK